MPGRGSATKVAAAGEGAARAAVLAHAAAMAAEEEDEEMRRRGSRAGAHLRSCRGGERLGEEGEAV